MSDCTRKDCSCENVGIGDCNKLQELNDLQIRPKMREILKAEWCNLPEAIRRAFYGVWCVLKNIINQLCYILAKVECLEKKVDNLCSVAKCQDERISGLIEHLKGKMLENVTFGMDANGSVGNDGNGETYTKVSTQPNGSFTLNWNMVLANTEVGRGTITGKVNHMYTLNDDGTIRAHIENVTFDGVSYSGNGGSYSNGKFTITAGGQTVWTKAYNPGSSWSDSIPTISVGKDVTLQPQGGNTGQLIMFQTLDEWETTPTRGEVRASYVNNNSPLPKSEGCVIDCDNC